jgi:glycosyltransferase involved in cell wall biosynthesis
MKILTFTHLFPNEIQPMWGIFVYQRVNHFAKRPGNQVRVVAPVPYIPRWFPTSNWEKYKRIRSVEKVGDLDVEHPRYPLLPKIGMPLHGLLLFLGCYRYVARLHREEGFDCIDSHWVYPDGFAAVLLGKMLGVPVFCSARGTDINLYPSFKLIRPLIRWTLRETAGIIAVSESLKQEIAKLGIDPEKIRVIGNGVDPDRFEVMDRREARTKLGLPRDVSLVIAVGTLNEHKNHALLLSSFSQIAQSRPGMLLVILGEGHLRCQLEAQIKEKNLQDRVLLPGSQSNDVLKTWFNAADVSCLSSSREGWPNVLMESLACGTPVVATRVGGVPEVIKTKEYGVLVEPEVAAFAQGLEKALDRKWDREEIARYARSRTWNEVAVEMEVFLSQRILRSAR